jgi:2-octaprenyl-6-methoxyphenol hydroxylase
MTDFDVIIAGGGLVGGCLAIGLASRGQRVAVIEAVERNADHQPSYDDRTLVINAASLNILDNLGLLPKNLTRMAIRKIRISRAGGLGHLELNATDYDQEQFGAVLVARELGNVLLEAMSSYDAITSFCPARLEGFHGHRSRIEATLDDGRSLSASLLVGADGNRSRVRELAGLPCQQHDYRQSAMIFNIQPERAEAHTAWERFTAQGPLALLPQPEERLGVVWIDKSEQIESAMTWADEKLCDQLKARFGSSLGRFFNPGRRSRYPLVCQRTPWPVAERVVVIGNAANAVHPVSAQGFNLGLRDVGGLIDALEEADDPGDPSTLQDYARARQADQESTVRYTDTLARAFTNPSVIASLASGLGLAAHAGFPGLSRRLVRSAMGFREPVCSLARHPRISP